MFENAIVVVSKLLVWLISLFRISLHLLSPVENCYIVLLYYLQNNEKLFITENPLLLKVMIAESEFHRSFSKDSYIDGLYA